MKYSRIIIVFCLCILPIAGLACSLFGEETTTPPTSPPSAPILSSPNNDAVVQGSSITFTWQGSSDTTAYFLRVSNSAYPNLDDETSFFNEEVGNSLQYTVSGFPGDGTKYVWGVYSGNAAGWCDKSEVLANKRIFTNGQASSPPSAPTLIKPDNGAIVYGTSVAFQWEPVNGATSYQLLVSTVNNPDPVESLKFSGNVGDVSTYTDTGYFKDGTTYYWWVNAINTAGISPWPEVIANSRNFISHY